MNTSDIIKRNATGKNFVGSVLLYLGVLLFLRNIGIYVPDWLTGFPLILLVGGLFQGFRHDFTKPAAYYMIIFGAFFLVEDILEEIGNGTDLPFFPVILIAIGVHLMLGRRRRASTFVTC